MKLARYRCPFPDCGRSTAGLPDRAPPCPECGRVTLRVLEPVKVNVIRDGRGWPKV